MVRVREDVRRAQGESPPCTNVVPPFRDSWSVNGAALPLTRQTTVVGAAVDVGRHLDLRRACSYAVSTDSAWRNCFAEPVERDPAVGEHVAAVDDRRRVVTTVRIATAITDVETIDIIAAS